MKHKLVLSLAALGVALSFGSCRCGGKDEPAVQTINTNSPSPSAPSSAHLTSMTSASAKASPLPWASIPSATAISLPNMPIPERFQYEKDTRPPNAHPTVEETWAALEKDGLVIVEKKQHLASPFGARYCEGARAVKDDKTTTVLQLSVCEYITAEVAATAGPYSQESMKNLMPSRRVHPHKRSALIIRPEGDAPENKALAEKAATTFKTL